MSTLESAVIWSANVPDSPHQISVARVMLQKGASVRHYVLLLDETPLKHSEEEWGYDTAVQEAFLTYAGKVLDTWRRFVRNEWSVPEKVTAGRAA